MALWALREAGLAVELLETPHVKTALSTMPVKTDRISGAFDAPSVRTAAVCCSLWRSGSWRSPISWWRRSLICAIRPEPSAPWLTFGAPAFSPLRVAMKTPTISIICVPTRRRRPPFCAPFAV
jgi:hypothetical protein